MKSWLAGLIGLTVGSVGTYFLMKDYAEKEISDMRDYVRERLKEDQEKDGENGNKSKEKDSNDDKDEELYRHIIKHHNYSDSPVRTNRRGGDEVAKIFEIDEDEFNSDLEHEKITITWYPKSHILADDDEYKMTTDDIGGDVMLSKIDNCKYVRNDIKGIDYEILVDDVNTWFNPEADEEVEDEDEGGSTEE